jgi:hypothetical protein
MEQHEAQLDYLARVLIRCFILPIAVLTFWWLVFLVAGRQAYVIHSSMVAITRHEFDLINYVGMAVLKLLAFVLFLVPYISIRLVLRRRAT